MLGKTDFSERPRTWAGASLADATLGVIGHRQGLPRPRPPLPTALLLALLLTFLPIPTQAQVVAPVAGIEVPSQTQIANFPKDIAFTLSAKSPSDIVKATLRVKEVGLAVIVANQITFTPATSISLRHSWDLQRYYLPPGVDLEYYWLLEDAAGRQLRTPPVRFPLRDERFSWRSATADSVQINWYAGDEAFGADLLRAARAAHDQLEGNAGAASDTPVAIYVYANQKDLLSALRPSAQEWTGGVAFTEEGLVLAAVPPTASGLEYGRRVLPHELTHVVIDKVTQNPYGDLPRWLDEGLATYAEGELDPSLKTTLQEAVRRNTLISVRSLSANFPTDPSAARLSYAQSQSLVATIMREYGSARLQRLLAVFREGATGDEALRAALGVDSDGLEAAWRVAIGAPPTPAVAVVRQTPYSQDVPTGPWPLLVAIVALPTGTAVVVIWVRRRPRP